MTQPLEPLVRHLVPSTAFALLIAAASLLGACGNGVGPDGSNVGGSCVTSGQCTEVSRCLTGQDWPMGYCATSCDSDADCLEGSVCADREGGVCVQECSAAANCRNSEEEGAYECIELPAQGATGTVMGCARPSR